MCAHCSECVHFWSNPSVGQMYCTKLVKRITARRTACKHFRLPGYPMLNHPYCRSIRKAMCRKFIKQFMDAAKTAPEGSVLCLDFMENRHEMYLNTLLAFEVMNRLFTIMGYRTYLKSSYSKGLRLTIYL